jgi:DNA invertase Pin-like site-specific DNA recombinase
MNRLRCAIYTRKSSEEGLEQGFNSLHAQRDACAAYVLSQAGEGWIELETVYDDGGYSGGSMERPGLHALLADIAKGQIDIVVVYKVDRLTRSLADFARIVELFDKTGVSFVSVTQAFNTTSSMGRLTLNVLLSFAQFEREVTGERIRDKIAASKKKGLWMGGRPPLGYDGVDRKLVINPTEAETVRRIFHRYLELGSVIRLVEDLSASGVESKRWEGRKGHALGGGPLGRGALYHMLSNEVYRGGIRHRDKVYWDSHPAIIDAEVWDAVHARLNDNCPDHPASPRREAPVLLKGILHDARGVPMTPIHANRHGRRYRYYVARDLIHGGQPRAGRLSRIAMGVMDEFVLATVPARLRADFIPDAAQCERVLAGLLRIDLMEGAVTFQLRSASVSSDIDRLAGRITRSADFVEIAIPISLKHRQGATIIEPPEATNAAPRIDRALVRAVALANSWSTRLAAGEATSLSALAKADGYCAHYAARLLPLAWLAPDIVEKMLSGSQPRALSLGALTKDPLPVSWQEQRVLVDRCGLGRR